MHPSRPRLRDLLIVLPVALFGVVAVIVGAYVVAGVCFLAAIAVFWWLTIHQGPATATKQEQAEEQLRMSDSHHGSGGLGGL